jgi:small subunit ribosomal protein S9
MIKNEEIFISAIGRRKTATAIIKLLPIYIVNSKKLFEVNGRLGTKYFHYNYNYLSKILLPLKKTNLLKNYKILVDVHGGGLNGQAEAIQLGISRAICQIDKAKFRPLLKKENLLVRDSRIKERKKYGLKKARKASQFSKR